MIAAADGAPRPRAWYAVLLFTILLVFSLLDRMALLLVVDPVRAALTLTDTKIGLLVGFGFGVVYALAGVPLAHIVDNGRRVRVAVIGVFVWTACTIASGFAQDYAQLLVLRSGVAIGEAALTPAAMSLIGDLFPLGRRTLPTTVYFSVSAPMTTGGALVVGGAALAMAQALSARIGLEPWRLMLVLVGVPTLLLLVLAGTVKEPPRREDAASRSIDFASPRETLRYVWNERGLWGQLFLSLGLTSLANAALFTWAVSLLTRAHGLSAVNAGYLYGGAAFIGAVGGTLFWPSAATMLERKGREDALISMLGAGLILILLAVALAGAGWRAGIVVAAGFLSSFGTGALSILPSLIVQRIAPARLRARLVAGTFLPSYIIGLGLGPVLTAWTAEHFFVGTRALGYSMLLWAVALLPVVAFSMWRARSSYLSIKHASAATHLT